MFPSKSNLANQGQHTHRQRHVQCIAAWKTSEDFSEEIQASQLELSPSFFPVALEFLKMHNTDFFFQREEASHQLHVMIFKVAFACEYKA